MVDLTKFSKEDLKKTAAEINTYLKKVDEKDYDPNQSTPDAAHLEDKLGGTTKKIEDKGGEGEKTEKSLETKKDFPGGKDETENMTAPSQGDMQMQILAMLKEILGKLSAPPAPPMPAPTDQIQHSVVPSTPAATPATTSSTSTDTKVPEKGDININVTKSQIEEVLKGMGITPSGVTQKPKQDVGHPIEKTGSMTYDKIKKMSWDELYNYDQEINPKAF